VKALLVVAALAAVVTGAAAAAGPAARHTSSGTAAARASLITKSDLGKGWSAASAATAGLQVSCVGHRPSGKGIVEIGAASSPTYSGSKVGPFIVQLTSVYATKAQASAYWRRAITSGLIACTKQSLQALTAKGIKVRVDAAGGLGITKVTPMTAAYRVVASLTSPARRNLKAYTDWIFVAQGRSVTEIMVSSFQRLPVRYEYALAVIADHHMALPSA
jgi:hypothetical protein